MVMYFKTVFKENSRKMFDFNEYLLIMLSRLI